MPFGFNVQTRLASLENNLNVYEEISRRMVAKLESAVDRISDNITNSNQMITSMLAKHDERIEIANETNRGIVDKIKELKQDITNEMMYIKNDIQTFKQDYSTYRSTMSKEFDTKINDVSKTFVVSITNLESKLEKLEIKLDNIKEPTFTNAGKLAIITLLGSALVAGFITFYFTAVLPNNHNKSQILNKCDIELVKYGLTRLGDCAKLVN